MNTHEGEESFAWFTFTFTVDDEDGDYEYPSIVGMFKIYPENTNGCTALLQLLDPDIWGVIASELEEEYGIHDWGSGQNEFVGYNSYEVDEERIPELMQKWYKQFTDRNIKVDELSYLRIESNIDHDIYINLLKSATINVFGNWAENYTT